MERHEQQATGQPAFVCDECGRLTTRPELENPVTKARLAVGHCLCRKCCDDMQDHLVSEGE
jgi:hypothetical protein